MMSELISRKNLSQSTGPRYWRSLDELSQSLAFKQMGRLAPAQYTLVTKRERTTNDANACTETLASSGPDYLDSGGWGAGKSGHSNGRIGPEATLTFPI